MVLHTGERSRLVDRNWDMQNAAMRDDEINGYLILQ